MPRVFKEPIKNFDGGAFKLDSTHEQNVINKQMLDQNVKDLYEIPFKHPSTAKHMDCKDIIGKNCNLPLC